MHWLDSTPSREIDPVLDCLTFLARQADRPSSPVLLRAGLALSPTGTLPFHQIEPPLEQVGMRGEPVVRRRIAGWRIQQLPAIVELNDDRAMSMVAAGLGVTVAPSSFLRAGLAAVKLAGFTLSRDVGLVFSDRVRERSGAFVDAVRATYAASGAGRKVR